MQDLENLGFLYIQSLPGVGWKVGSAEHSRSLLDRLEKAQTTNRLARFSVVFRLSRPKQREREWHYFMRRELRGDSSYRFDPGRGCEVYPDTPRVRTLLERWPWESRILIAQLSDTAIDHFLEGERRVRLATSSAARGQRRSHPRFSRMRRMRDSWSDQRVDRRFDRDGQGELF